ncbi:BatA domain-containing protein [Tunicatimonas pelagia]|uniref:BatA domain-containing protein n=1 Tax=Tunicatimonas pelagia TaxID=931531 RepID=UPI002666E005|nr:BatA domain-containing protein [Tunicatimonas pelagia]WKN41194.1 BatA domain-containing protein [Tunicatimonas pelagia]
MSFVYPSFLWGLLALAIPIIIHLFNFRRTKKIYFSNNQFLKNVKETTTSKLKVKHLLILLARLAFIAFLVLTFAQPYLPGENDDEAGSGENPLVYLYLDNSLSMSSELANGVRGIDQGVSFVDEIATYYPRNTQYKLLTNGFGSFSRVPKSGEELTDLVTNVSLTGVARGLDEVLQKIQGDVQLTGMQGNEIQRADVYLISDFQKSTIGEIQGSKLGEDTTLQVNLVPVQSSYQHNVFVDSMYLANPFMMAGQANELAVALRNEGGEAVENLIVRLLINEQQVGSGSVDINAYATNTVNFPLNFPLQQQNQCRVVFEDYPVTFDNEFFFTLNLGDKINVLEITSNLAATRVNSATNVARVYANESVFNFQSFSIDNLDYSLLDNTNLLILNEIEGGNQNASVLLPYIREFLEDEGHMVFILPSSGDVSFLSEVTQNTSLAAQRQTYTDSTGVRTVTLANPDLANPFFDNMFEGQADNFDMPFAVPLVNHNLPGSSLLRYKTGDPYLLSLRTPFTSGDQIFVFSTPLRQEFTSLYRHAIFVPVMYRLASMSKSLDVPLYYPMDENTITLEASRLLDSASREATGPRYLYKLRRDEQELIPTQRAVNGRLLMEVPQNILEAGFYELVRTEEAANAADSAVGLLSLSFNNTESESLVEPYTVDELQQQIEGIEGVSLYEADDVEGFTALMQSKNDQVALWKYALLLALASLLAEILLIRFL